MKRGAKLLIGYSLIAGAMSTALVSLPQTVEASTTTYTVKSGDTLWKISQRYGMTVEQLKKLNGLKSNITYPGQVLKVSKSGSGGGTTKGSSSSNLGNADKYVVSATRSVQVLSNGVEARILPHRDRQRANFYGNYIKRLDKKASNKLYKVVDKGFSYWSPVRQKNAGNGGVSNGQYTFENFFVEYNTNQSGSLGGIYMADPSVTKNFKTKQMKPGRNMDVTITRRNIRNYVMNSPIINHGGTFKGQSGRWRFAGYSNDGSSLQDHLFPPDYYSNSIKNTKWDEYAKYGNRLFNQTIYDTKYWEPAKRRLVQRLMNQHPVMKQMYPLSKWMRILSLQTEPEENPVTGKKDGSYGGAVFMAYNTNGTRYKSLVLYQDHSTNLNLSKLTVTSTSTIGSSGKRYIYGSVARREAESRDIYKPSIPASQRTNGKVVPGMTYRVEATVQNMSRIRNTKYTPTTVDVGVAKNYNNKRIETDGVYDKEYDAVQGKATRSGNIRRNSSVVASGNITIPKDAKPGSKIRVGAEINDRHRIHGDNLNYTDDDLILTLDVATGNIKATEVTLVDENGKEVSSPLPGRKYKMRYKFKYDGPSIKDPVKVTVNYQNTRKLPDGNQEAIIYQNGSTTKKDVSASKSIRLTDGKSYYIDSLSYQWYEIPWIRTTATLSTDVPGLNTNKDDDKYSKTWDDKYDYSIENLQVVARTERNGAAADGKQHYGVSFTVNNEMPKAARDDNYAKDVNIRINLGGKTKIITEHITAGKNKDIVVDMALDNEVAPGSILNAKVDVNFDQLAWESDKGPKYSNNSATTKVVTANIMKDPITDALINPSNTSTNTGAIVDHPVNPNKQTAITDDNNTNTWTQRYEVKSWKGQKITYLGMNGTKTYSFFRYTPTANYVQNVTQSESYKVKDVLMKSKVTTDNNWGDNGWVSLLTDPGHAQVKAGYGYQMKLIVEYKTNAFSTEPVASMNPNGSGTSVRPQNVMPNIPEDVYFQTPDGKIISASGTHGTNQMFVSKVLEKTKEKLVVEYTLKDTYTMGIKTPGRIYIAEDTPNGVYNVRAWTPTINGVPTKNRHTTSNGFTLYTPKNLIDIQGLPVSSKPSPIPTKGTDAHGNPIIDTSKVPSMSIVVVGSDKDDLIDSIVQ